MMKFLLACSLFLALTASASDTKATRFKITVENLTKGQILTTPVLALHRPSFKLFREGQEASEALQALAEDGHLDGLISQLRGELSRVETFKVFERHILPGQSQSIFIKTKLPSLARLSLVSMLASTNDAFIALNGERLPFKKEKVLGPRVYDAGTEYNSELCQFVPGPPCGSHDARDSTRSEAVIAPFTGLHGNGDLDLAVYGFEGSPAKITIEKLK